MKINFTLFGAKLTGGTFNIVEPAQRLAQRGHEVVLTSIGSPADLNWFKKSRKPLFKENFTPFADKFLYKVYRKLLKGSVLHPFPDVEIKDLIRSMPDCDVNIATAAPTTFAVHRSGKGRGFYYIQHFDSLFVKDDLIKNIHNESYFLPLNKISVSSWIKDRIENDLKVEVNNVITAGIDEKVFYPRSNKNGNKKRIVSLGRKVDWKGFWELREAIKELFKKRDDFEWVVYSAHDTPEPSFEAPFTLIKSPYGKDLAELYSSCDIAVNPSWHEGFAQPALEAMACGAAVVTTPVGAEDFAKNNKNCLLVDPQNPKKIEESIEKLLDDQNLRDKLIDGGLRTAKDFYWDKIIDKWEAVIKKI